MTSFENSDVTIVLYY